MKITQTLSVLLALFAGANAQSAQAQDDHIWQQCKATEGENAKFSKIVQAEILTMNMKLPFG